MEILLAYIVWGAVTASNTLNKLFYNSFSKYYITHKLIYGRCSWTSYWSVSASPNQCGKKIPNKYANNIYLILICIVVFEFQYGKELAWDHGALMTINARIYIC